MDITELPETRPITDSLATLELHIRQKEDGGANLVLVVAGKQAGINYNFVSFVVPQGVNKQPPQISLVAISVPVETEEQTAAVEANLEQQGKTALFLAPIFDSGTLVMVAVCREGVPTPALPIGTLLLNPPPPTPPDNALTNETKSFNGTKPLRSAGLYHRNSSQTEGLQGTETIFSDSTHTIDATEQLKALRGGQNFGPRDARQIRTVKDGKHLIKQSNYCWMQRTLPDVVLVDNFPGFPAGINYRSGKATRFGKLDQQDEGTGSELLKVVQTNSDVFGVSLKKSLLVACFGAPLSTKPDVLKAMVEVFHPRTGKFARVPIVDVGPREDLEAQIDLTLALDKFLGTEGGRTVQFRIVL